VKLIPLTQGQYAQVDDDDFERVNEHRWLAQWSICSRRFYAVRWSRGGRKSRRHFSLHHEVTGILNTVQIDHADGDSLNCQKYNLRACTYSQNQANKGKPRNNTSGYKGVYWNQGAWVAQIKFSAKITYLGRFTSPIDAAHAYDHAAREVFGAFAYCNFPD
jgi:hypothetical protein